MNLKGVQLFNLIRDRRARRNFSPFASLVANPQTSGAITMPAAGRFFFVAIGDTPADTPVASIVATTSRDVVSGEMLAGEKINAGYLERDTVVTMEPGFELHVEDSFGVTRKIFGEA